MESSQREKILTSLLEHSLIDAEATRAIVAAKGSPELLMPFVKESARVLEEDGKFVVRVFDKTGNTRIGDANGAPMTIAQLVAEMREDELFGRAFDASGATGGGASSGGSSKPGIGAPNTIKRAVFDAMPPASRAEAIKNGANIID